MYSLFWMHNRFNIFFYFFMENKHPIFFELHKNIFFILTRLTILMILKYKGKYEGHQNSIKSYQNLN